jgi:predicted RNA-binding Zn-ribbon protein involved in translation (DUF1610 family)
MITELEEKWVCPNCGEKMHLSPDSLSPTYVCPKCGCSIEAENQDFSSEGICPNCNQALDDGNECPYCGYDLGTDFD